MQGCTFANASIGHYDPIRGLSAALIVNALSAVEAMIEPGGKLTKSTSTWHRGNQAAQWILSVNDDAPTDFLTCCNTLDLRPAIARDRIEKTKVRILALMDEADVDARRPAPKK
jgi:hypothetical protein